MRKAAQSELLTTEERTELCLMLQTPIARAVRLSGYQEKSEEDLTALAQELIKGTRQRNIFVDGDILQKTDFSQAVFDVCRTAYNGYVSAHFVALQLMSEAFTPLMPPLTAKEREVYEAILYLFGKDPDAVIEARDIHLYVSPFPAIELALPTLVAKGFIKMTQSLVTKTYYTIDRISLFNTRFLPQLRGLAAQGYGEDAWLKPLVEIAEDVSATSLGKDDEALFQEVEFQLIYVEEDGDPGVGDRLQLYLDAWLLRNGFKRNE